MPMHIAVALEGDTTRHVLSQITWLAQCDRRSGPILIVIDQGEELITRAGPAACSDFVHLLEQALADTDALWVLATVRSDFITDFLTSGYTKLLQRPILLGSLSRSQLSAVIEGPALQVGLMFAPGLVAQLVDETGGGDALPLLAFTLQRLHQLWLARGGGTIDSRDVHQLGGVAGTLARQADYVVAELEERDQDLPIFQTLLKFVSLDDNDEPTRRRIERASLTQPELCVVDAFIESRLLVGDTIGDQPVVDVAHEAIFRQWAPLRQVIRGKADDLRRRTELERLAQDWRRSGSRASYLLRDDRLQSALHWAAAQDVAGEYPLISEFIETSRRADSAALRRLSETVARRAIAVVPEDPELAVLFALAAIEECAQTPLAQRALLTALLAIRQKIVFHISDVGRCIAWSPDGRTIAAGSGSGTAYVWDTTTRRSVLHFVAHEDAIQSIAWSPDGSYIATASHDGSVRIWASHDGAEVYEFAEQDDVQGNYLVSRW